MLPFTLYFLKIMLCSGILFGYYRIVLRDKIFHQYNRFYLLAAVVLSVVLPLAEVNIWHNAGTPAPAAIKLLQSVSSNDYLEGMVASAGENIFTTEQLLSVTYTLVCLIFLVSFIIMLIKIRMLFVKHRHRIVEDIYFINTMARGTPFSFLKCIFWNDHIDPETTTGRQIFRHELAHVRQKHSYDKLFLQAVLIFTWFNPFFWLMRKELNMIHEFMADKKAVENNDTENFAAMILQAAYPRHHFQLTNPFFYSPIKRRLMMLTKNKKTKAGYIGRLLVLPLALLVFAAFTLKTNTIKTNPSVLYEGGQITVVMDAGHGGSDKGAQSIAGNILEKDLTLAIIKKIKALHRNKNIRIIFTRETDVFQTVKEKAAFSKAQNADLFVSIHVDATNTDSANIKTGLSVWVAKDQYANSNRSKLFASAVISEFTNNYPLPVLANPQQAETGIRVLQECDCPSVLIEAGYLTNNKDLAYLQSDAAKEIIAGNILLAIEKFALAKNDGQAAIETRKVSPTADLTPVKNDTVPETGMKNIGKALVIVDGKHRSQKELKAIPPQNIESVQVIKGKEATDRYGEKGRNGVIIVQTKMKESVLDNVKVVVHEKDTVSEIKIEKMEIKIKDEKIAGQKPLFVIDGKVQSLDFDIHSISTDDIIQIDVLKDKSAMDKYGEKAIFGVVEITTKSKAPIKALPITEDRNHNGNKNGSSSKNSDDQSWLNAATNNRNANQSQSYTLRKDINLNQ